MVGPTRDEAERGNDYSRIKWGFVVLVALSGGSVALQGDASPLVVALSTAGGALVGIALMEYLFWSLGT